MKKILYVINKAHGFLKEEYYRIFGIAIVLFGYYSFAISNTTIGLFSLIMGFYILNDNDVQSLRKELFETRQKQYDLEIKLGKLKWGIKD